MVVIDGSELTRKSIDGQARALALGELEEARGDVPLGLPMGSTSIGCSLRTGSALALGSAAAC
eukprot:13061726-Alexandrium_andersonii.AAC.1